MKVQVFNMCPGKGCAELHSLDWAEKRLMQVSLQVGSLVSVSHLCPRWVSSDSSQKRVQAHISAQDLIFHSLMLNPRRSLITPETAERMTTLVML